MIAADRLSSAVEQIVQAGVEASPRELCGLLCPDGSIVWLKNEVDADGEYLISAAQLNAVFTDRGGLIDRGWGLSDVVVWHTHPSGYIGPSLNDLRARRRLIVEDIPHLVVSLPEGEVTYY